MKTIRIYDPALCCSTGVCGVEVDPTLVGFAADFEWAKAEGALIERFNLAYAAAQAFRSGGTGAAACFV